MTDPALRRRAVLGGIAAGTAALAGCATGESTVDASPENRWLQHGRDPGKTGHAPAADGPTADPSVDWRREVDDGYVLSQPLVGSGIVLNAAGGGRLHLDPETGDRLWRDGGEYAHHTPAVGDGTVYLPRRRGIRATAADGGVEALGRRFRYERWTADLGPVQSPVTLADDALLVGVGDVVGPEEGGFAAVDAADGTERWFRPVETQVQGAPAVSNGLAVAVDRGAAPPGETRDVRAYAAWLDDGDREWTHTFGTTEEVAVNWTAGPVASEEFVYVPTTREVVALDLLAGTVAWRRPVDGGVGVSPAVADDTLFVGTPDGELLALAADSGEVRWRDDGHDGWLHAPVVADGTVYAVDVEGRLRGWTVGGDRRFRLELETKPVAQPAVGAGRLYVPTEDALYAVR